MIRNLAPVLLLAVALAPLGAEPLPVAPLQRDTAVSFTDEVLPFLRKNCLACHNQTKSKAGLILESPEYILKGGDTGPAAVPGDADTSLLFTTAAHIEEPVMPPAQNTSRAENLTPQQLAILKLWIDQGAKGGSTTLAAAPKTWIRSTIPSVYTLALSPDGRYAAAGRGHSVHLYDLRSRRLVARLDDPALKDASHHDLVQSLAFAPDGTLASGGFREVKLWRQPDWLPVASAPGKPEAPAAAPEGLAEKLAAAKIPFDPAKQSARLSPDGTRLVLLETGKAPRLLDGQSGAPVMELGLRPAEKTALDALAREEAMAKRLAALYTAEVPKLEDALKKEDEATTQAGTGLPAARAAARTSAAELAALEQESRLLTAQAGLLADDAPEKKPLTDKLAALATKIPEAAGKLTEANRAVELAERNRLTGARLAGDALARVALARARKAEADAAVAAVADRRKALETKLAEPAPAGTAAFSPDGTVLALGLEPGTIHLYLAADGTYLESFTAPAGLLDVRIDDAGLHTAHRDAGTLTWPWNRPWELAGTIGDGAAPDLLEDRVTALGFTPDSSRIVTGTGVPSRSGVLQVWDRATGKELARNDDAHHDTIVSIAFSPDATRLVTASTDGLAKIFRIEGLEPIRSLEAHTGHVLDVDWSHDGRLIVSAGADQQVKFWDAESGETTKSLTGWTREVTAVAFLSPATEQIVAASGDKSVKLDTTAIGSAAQFIHTAAVSADGQWIVTGDDTGSLQVWSATSRKVEFSFAPTDAGLAATGR